jgi:hypothetical protein
MFLATFGVYENHTATEANFSFFKFFSFDLANTTF